MNGLQWTRRALPLLYTTVLYSKYNAVCRQTLRSRNSEAPVNQSFTKEFVPTPRAPAHDPHRHLPIESRCVGLSTRLTTRRAFRFVLKCVCLRDRRMTLDLLYSTVECRDHSFFSRYEHTIYRYVRASQTRGEPKHRHSDTQTHNTQPILRIELNRYANREVRDERPV